MMTIRRTLLASLTLLLGATAAQAQSPIFLLDSEGGVSTFIFRVDPASGALTTSARYPLCPTGRRSASPPPTTTRSMSAPTAAPCLRVTVSPFAFTRPRQRARSPGGARRRATGEPTRSTRHPTSSPGYSPFPFRRASSGRYGWEPRADPCWTSAAAISCRRRAGPGICGPTASRTSTPSTSPPGWRWRSTRARPPWGRAAGWRSTIGAAGRCTRRRVRPINC